MPPPTPVFISSHTKETLGSRGLLAAPSKPLSSNEIVGGDGDVIGVSVKLREKAIRELLDMMSTSEEEGGHGKADAVRETA